MAFIEQNNLNLKSLRETYGDKDEFLENMVNIENPLLTVKSWLDTAIKSKCLEPNAMNLCTVNIQNNRPSSRFVLCKRLVVEPKNKMGLEFFTNTNSRKGQEIFKNNFVAATFYWAELHKSIRIEGKAIKMDSSDDDKYFYSRPIKSQAAAACSNQSQPIESKQKLLQNYEKKLNQAIKSLELLEPLDPLDVFKSSKPINVYNPNIESETKFERPQHWGGYLIVPDYIEFWFGNTFRLHDRISCKKIEGSDEWSMQRLQP